MNKPSSPPKTARCRDNGKHNVDGMVIKRAVVIGDTRHTFARPACSCGVNFLGAHIIRAGASLTSRCACSQYRLILNFSRNQSTESVMSPTRLSVEHRGRKMSRKCRFVTDEFEIRILPSPADSVRSRPSSDKGQSPERRAREDNYRQATSVRMSTKHQNGQWRIKSPENITRD